MAKKEIVKKTAGAEKSTSVDVKNVVNDINKMFKGRSPITVASALPKKPTIPTGIKELDDNFGGLPTGVSVVWGGESCSKSTLCLHVTVNAQKLGKTVLYMDIEKKFNPQRAAELGVDLEKLLFVSDLEYGEEAFEIIRNLARENAVDVIIIDSISTMAMKGEIFKGKSDREIAEAEMAIVAQKLAKGLKVINNDLERERCVHLLCVAQIRTKGLGSFIVTNGWSGGHAIKHYSKLTLGMRRGQGNNAPVRDHKVINEETGRLNTVKEVVGFESVIKIEKNHLSALDGQKRYNEGAELRLPFYYETGFVKPSWVDEVVDSGEVTEVDCDEPVEQVEVIDDVA